MGSSSPGVYPHDVLKAKVFSQRGIDDLDRHGHELPALVAYVCLVAACSDVVVVRKIDIEAQFFGERFECCGIPQRLSVTRVRVVDGSNFEPGGHEAENVLLEAGTCWSTQAE